MTEPTISFHSESTEFHLSDETKFSTWLTTVATKHLKVIGEINYIFCDDAYLININKTYLDHDTYTDIITFPYNYDPIESDIYISIERIEENAKSFGVPTIHELKRVMVHGLLHLIGFNDKTKMEQQEMSKQEDISIKLF